MERNGFGGTWKKYEFNCNICKKNFFMRRVAGFTGMCTKCRTKKWFSDNAEHLKDFRKKYREENKEKIAKTTERWRQKNIERLKIKAKEKRLNQLEELKEKERNKSAKYRETHRKECNERISNWKKKNKPLLRVYRQRRRVRTGKRDFSAKLYNELLERQNYKCVYCFKDITEVNSFDHIIPIVRGGDNSPENLQLLCPFCNTSKGSKNHEEFLIYRNYVQNLN